MPLHVVQMTSRDGPAGDAIYYQEEVRAAESLLLPFLEVKPPEEEAACCQIGVNRHSALA
jgi:hypothetical protein